MRTISEMEKARVFKGSSRLAAGKIRYAVFHPAEPRLVGFVVHRHDTLGMVKHEDRFLAYDAFDVSDGSLHVREGRSAWDQGACERLGVDYDQCTIWKDMPARTEDGVELGFVRDVEYDEATGRVLGVIVSEGQLADTLVGGSVHDGAQVLGFRDGAVMLAVGQQKVPASGGLAERAGTAVGTARVHMKAKGADAARTMDEAVQRGAYALGEQIGRVRDAAQEKGSAAAQAADDAVQKGAYALGRHLGRTKGMFSAFKEEYQKAVNGEDDDE